MIKAHCFTHVNPLAGDEDEIVFCQKGDAGHTVIEAPSIFALCSKAARFADPASISRPYRLELFDDCKARVPERWHVIIRG